MVLTVKSHAVTKPSRSDTDELGCEAKQDIKSLKVSDLVKRQSVQQKREHCGVVVERLTLNREVLGSIPTSVTMLCP